MKRGLVITLGLLAACTIADVDWSGKECTTTCPGELQCIDGACARVDTAAWIVDLHLDWATPNAIRWAWKLQGQGPALESYELVLTSSRSGAAGVKTWTSTDLAVLGGWQLQVSNGYDPIDGAITYDLDPSTPYEAVVRVHDRAGRTFTSRPARGSTDAPRATQLAFFDETLPPGSYTLPDAPILRVEPDGVGGGNALRFAVAREGPAVDFEYLRIQGATFPFPPISDKLFGVAYLEFWIRGQGRATSSWSDVWIKLRQADGSECPSPGTACIWGYTAKWIYHPDPTSPIWRKVQIPISQMRNGVTNAPLTLGDLSRSLEGVGVGCSYNATTDTTDLDKITLAW